ncbi:MAG: asparagine synthase (glutamine-hydrolyzing) [Bacteroidota bacterium]|nr:asparagine synthase (glutamine-hydrolyzing) [Bacteroidota bacterium]
MCGIAGIINYKTLKPVEVELLVSVRDSLVLRGPDDADIYIKNWIGLSHRRLSIIDLSPLGKQPMHSVDERYSIIFNGEVYNYQDLKKPLIEKGYKFRTETDTEVLMQLFAEEGIGMLQKLNGMFSVCIYDHQTNDITIFRDRLGVKPFYYSLTSDGIVFASEIKALFKGGVDKTYNESNFNEVLIQRHVAGENTMFGGVKKLLPGHYMTIKRGELTINRWWNLADYSQYKDNNESKSSLQNWYRDTFDDSVRLRQISDVPVGVLLSGGLDSSSTAASIGLNGSKEVSSFTVRFHEKGYDEGDLAKEVADKYKLNFNELYINSKDILEKYREILSIHDEPVMHASDLYVKEISKFAKKKVTVLLSGEGGDETLGGYVRYQPLKNPAKFNIMLKGRRLLKLIPSKSPRVKKLMRLLELGSIENYIHFNSTDLNPNLAYSTGLNKQIMSEYRTNLYQTAKSLYGSEPIRMAMFYDMHTYLCSLLDRNDLMTMGASIECRVPFLDYRIIQKLAGTKTEHFIYGDKTKALLRDSIGNRLPESILTGRKWGFGVPWASYYRNDPFFSEYLKYIHNHQLIKQHFKTSNTVSLQVKKFLNGDDSLFGLVNQLISVTKWYDIQFERNV